MRGRPFGVRWTNGQGYSQTAERLGFDTRGAPEFAHVLIDFFEIDSPEEFADIFRPQAEEIKFIWVPGMGTFRQATGIQNGRGERREHYIERYESCRNGSRLVVGYKSKIGCRVVREDRRLEAIDRDEFTFDKSQGGLVLARFTVKSPFFDRYDFRPSMPDEEKQKRLLLGIYNSRFG